MIVLADENQHRGIANRLAEAGHEVTHIPSLSPSVTDDEVLAKAVEAGSLLITKDLDVGELVFSRGAHHAGVLLLRLGAMPFPDQAQAPLRPGIRTSPSTSAPCDPKITNWYVCDPL